MRKYGYPPDKQEKATRTLLEQAEVLSDILLQPAQDDFDAERTVYTDQPGRDCKPLPKLDQQNGP